MTLHPVSHAGVPEQTAHLFARRFPNGHPFQDLREELGSVFHDEQCAHLSASTGRSAESPAVLAVVTILHAMDGLTDRQAAEAVDDRLTWRYLLGLAPDDPGVHVSRRSDVRARLIAGGAERLRLDHVLACLHQRGLVTPGGKQRADSTAVESAIRNLNRVELVGATLRQALNHLAIVVPDGLRAVAPEVWYNRYSERIDSWR